MPKWAEDGTQVVTPPDAKIERGFTRGQGVSVGHLNYALSLEGSNFYDPYPDVFEAVAGDLSAAHGGGATPRLPALRFGYDSAFGGGDFFTIGTYAAGTPSDPTGTLTGAFSITIGVDDNYSLSLGGGQYFFFGPSTSSSDGGAAVATVTYNLVTTGYAFSNTHGFEAGRKRVNTGDTAADTRRYAYPSTDPLEIEINLSPTLGGWSAIDDNSTTAPNTVEAATIATVNNDGYLRLTRASGTNDYAIRTPLRLRANKESNVPINKLTKITFDCRDSACDTITVEVVAVAKERPPGSAPSQAVVASATSTPDPNHQQVTATVSVNLTPSSSQYFVQVRAVDSSSGASSALVRDVILKFEKVAVE